MFDGLCILFVFEIIDDIVGGDVEESFVVFVEVVVSIWVVVEGFDVFIVEGKSGGGVFNNFFLFV